MRQVVLDRAESWSEVKPSSPAPLQRLSSLEDIQLSVGRKAHRTIRHGGSSNVGSFPDISNKPKPSIDTTSEIEPNRQFSTLLTDELDAGSSLLHAHVSARTISVDESDMNPLRPCGACLEWLKKIAEVNPEFVIMTFTDVNCEGIYIEQIDAF
jgi:hypothetical protein